MSNEKADFLVALVAMVAGLLLSGISDSKASIADNGVLNNEIASSVNQTDSATVTITWTTAPHNGS